MFFSLSKLLLLFFFFTSSPLLVQYSWVVFLAVKVITGVVFFFGSIYVIFNALDWYFYHYTSVTSNSLSEKKDLSAYRNESYPKGYPVGWYPLCWSTEVAKGEIIQKNALGNHYAIFRGDLNGEVGVLDAYCPHLGANLTVGGKVCNDMIQCSFHAWKFNKNGECQDIPYLNADRKSSSKKLRKIPANANAKSYICREYHGMICVYYDGTIHEKGQDLNSVKHPNKLPIYHLPLQSDLESDEFQFVGSLDYGIINMHIQEFAENAADWMHFAPIHGKMMFPFTQLEIPFINRWLSVHHSPQTLVGNRKGTNADSVKILENDYGPCDKHFLYFINNAHLKWKGKSLPNTDGLACITFCGPAGVCIFRFSIPAWDPDAHIVLFHTHLPENEMDLRVKFHWYAHKSLPKLLVWYVVGNWIAQWTNDINIWENKILRQKPCLVKGDGPIWKVRRWWRTFYECYNSDSDDSNNKEKVIIVDDDNVNEIINNEKESNNQKSKLTNMDW